MRPNHYTRGEWQNKHSRDNTPLQNLSSKRNWSTAVMIAGMIGGLRYLNRIWKLDQGLYERAIWALECLQIDIDQKWYEARDLEKANAQQHGGNDDAQHAVQGELGTGMGE